MMTATQRVLNEQHVARRQRMFLAAVKPKPILEIVRDPVAERPTIDDMIVSYYRARQETTPFFYSDHRPNPPINFIIQQISARYKMPVNYLLSPRRVAPLVLVRHIGCWLAKNMTIKSLPEIGRRFGRRDHTSILHAVRRIEKMRAADPDFAAETDALKDSIQAAWEATGQ